MQVRTSREAKGWSQEHLAAASGVSLRTVQRAEAGARVSPENTLALCAALDIQPTDLPAAPSTNTQTLPHLAVLRSALDAALAEFGERPTWQKTDASPVLSEALRHMGLPPDEDGFAEAARRIRRSRSKLDLAELVLFPVVLAWIIGFITSLACLFALLKGHSANWNMLGPAMAVWLVSSVPLVMIVLRMERAWRKIEPRRIPGVAHASVVASDLHPVEAALTRDFLWIARLAFGKAHVVRIRLDAIKDVTVHRCADGSHSARFLVEELPLMHDVDAPAFVLTRLRDDEAGWLDRRFGGLRKAAVWSPGMVGTNGAAPRLTVSAT